MRKLALLAACVALLTVLLEPADSPLPSKPPNPPRTQTIRASRSRLRLLRPTTTIPPTTTITTTTTTTTISSTTTTRPKRTKPTPVRAQGSTKTSNVSSGKSSGPGRLLGTFKATCYQLRGRTASGKPAGPGSIAVDPRVIPLRTPLYVEGYGNGDARDTGGAIKGHRIDIWKSSCAGYPNPMVKVWTR